MNLFILSFPRRRESRDIWIRVFYISGFPLPREQAWIPAFAGMTVAKQLFKVMSLQKHQSSMGSFRIVRIRVYVFPSTTSFTW
jgi:hypothetical protein